MGLFSQPLNRGRSSIRAATPKVATGFYHHDDIFLLAPVKVSESFSLDCNKTKRYYLPQRFWNIIQPPKGSSSSNIYNLQMTSVVESDTGRSMSPVDEWESENDHVNLLPQKTATNNRSAIYSNEGEGFGVKTTILPTEAQSKSAEFPMQKPTSELATNSTNIRSHKTWNRVCSNKSGRNCIKSKKSKKEIEIQFECFLEDDENSYSSPYLPSLSTPSTTVKDSTKSSLTKRTKSVQSWLTHTLGVMKKGCTVPVTPNYRQSPKLHEGDTTESSRGCDDECQIIFERRTNIRECTNECISTGSLSVEDEVALAFGHTQRRDIEAPIQFNIPNSACKPVYSWDYKEERNSIYDESLDLMGAAPKAVLVPIV